MWVSPRTVHERTDCTPRESQGQKSVRKTSRILGVHGRMLSLGLHWGLRVQTQLAEILYADVGEEHQQNKQNRREIYPGELRHSGMCNPIKINIS